MIFSLLKKIFLNPDNDLLRNIELYIKIIDKDLNTIRSIDTSKANILYTHPSILINFPKNSNANPESENNNLMHLSSLLENYQIPNISDEFTQNSKRQVTKN